MAVSQKMTLSVLSKEAAKKGVSLVGTGDCLHPVWLKEIKEMQKIDEGTFELNKTRFILPKEVWSKKVENPNSILEYCVGFF